MLRKRTLKIWLMKPMNTCRPILHQPGVCECETTRAQAGNEAALFMRVAQILKNPSIDCLVSFNQAANDDNAIEINWVAKRLPNFDLSARTGANGLSVNSHDGPRAILLAALEAIVG